MRETLLKDAQCGMCCFQSFPKQSTHLLPTDSRNGICMSLLRCFCACMARDVAWEVIQKRPGDFNFCRRWNSWVLLKNSLRGDAQPGLGIFDAISLDQDNMPGHYYGSLMYLQFFWRKHNSLKIGKQIMEVIDETFRKWASRFHEKPLKECLIKYLLDNMREYPEMKSILGPLDSFIMIERTRLMQIYLFLKECEQCSHTYWLEIDFSRDNWEWRQTGLFKNSGRPRILEACDWNFVDRL